MSGHPQQGGGYDGYGHEQQAGHPNDAYYQQEGHYDDQYYDDRNGGQGGQGYYDEG